MTNPSTFPEIAVLIPCFNEAGAIGQTVDAFRQALPDARIFVYDNNSTDETIAVAEQRGAIVRREPLQGKGNVVRRMFADIDADIYLLVDGDATYDASRAPELVQLVARDGNDMVTGTRISEEVKAYRFGHRFGNVLFTELVARIFGRRNSDVFSGYRAFSRRFVKSFPALSQGFEIETELTVHALELRMPVAELETRYSARPEGTASKLSTVRDGFRILGLIARLMTLERPLPTFGLFALLFAIAGMALGVPVITEFFETGLVPRLPTAVLAASMMLLSALSFVLGMTLDGIMHARQEMRRLIYLSLPHRVSDDRASPRT
ncbi:glycosyltransferase [Nisaea sediminum]|uniref:glycosyltransferase n=1 Tax=Nisaea sediminum TaxID=2775867 RepID=UPI001866FEEF|nr:glycosyltransferase [Nisaea sediminum]